MFTPAPKPPVESKEQKKARQIAHAYAHKLAKAKEGKPKKKRSKAISLPKLKARVQKAVNAYVRLRDQYEGCISCGGKVEQAGHYINQGSCANFRFNLHNINGQCIACNLFKRGNLISYRKNLVKKIGVQSVEDLEDNMHVIKKWSRDELVGIELFMKNKTKELQENPVFNTNVGNENTEEREEHA